MIQKKTSWVILLIAIALPHISWAAPAFDVVCDDDNVVAFRYASRGHGESPAAQVQRG